MQEFHRQKGFVKTINHGKKVAYRKSADKGREMWNLYLDESGDLGFNLQKRNSSNYFVVTILTIEGMDRNRALINAVKKTLNRKLNPRNKRKRIVTELKGSKTSLDIKKYFYEQIQDIDFNIYSVVIDKRDVPIHMIKTGSHFYNVIARMLIEDFPFEIARVNVNMIIDKSKARPEVRTFNGYIKQQVERKIDPLVRFHINHVDSQQNYGLQAVDMFSYGIFERFERERFDWYNVFEQKIKGLSEY